MELMEDGTTIEQQMFAMATEKKVPLYGVLELLPLCNLNCDMCYVRNEQRRRWKRWEAAHDGRMDENGRRYDESRDTICSFDRWRAAAVSTFPRVISKTP